MTKERKHFTPEEKVNILKTHLIDRKSIADICDAHKIKPVTFYLWQKQFFENGHLAFHRNKKDRSQTTILRLEQKLTQKNEVLSELMEEHVALKKKLGAI